jgi:hypothetical protein
MEIGREGANDAQPCLPPLLDIGSFDFDFDQFDELNWDNLGTLPGFEGKPDGSKSLEKDLSILSTGQGTLIPSATCNAVGNGASPSLVSLEIGDDMAEIRLIGGSYTRPAGTSTEPTPLAPADKIFRGTETPNPNDLGFSEQDTYDHQRACSSSLYPGQSGVPTENWFPADNISKTLLIHGLPTTTNQAHLQSLMAWSSEFAHARVLDPTSWSMAGFCSAVFHFSTYYGAEIAKELLNGRPNFDATAYMDIEFATDMNPQQSDFNLEAASAVKACYKRHKWSEEHISFLENMYMSNPKPNNVTRREIALELRVEEKHVQIWFNNARQRQKRGKSASSDSPTPSLNCEVTCLKQVIELKEEGRKISLLHFHRNLWKNSRNNALHQNPQLKDLRAASLEPITSQLLKSLKPPSNNRKFPTLPLGSTQ